MGIARVLEHPFQPGAPHRQRESADLLHPILQDIERHEHHEHLQRIDVVFGHPGQMYSSLKVLEAHGFARLI